MTGLPFKPTEAQLPIINADKESRILVQAGPGTGKTAVACARVAKLLTHDNLTPSSILMLSFTRTAVAEMKERIKLWAETARVAAVNVCTLDQSAFSFGVGCGDQFKDLMGSFEGNIKNALRHLTGHDALLVSYLGDMRHIIIDEAQDLTGIRARFVIEVLKALPAHCGVTIFADSAQAIYGFTSDVDGGSRSNDSFLQLFQPSSLGFSSTPLTEIHRTTSADIVRLFTESRSALLGCKRGPARVDAVLDIVRKAAACSGDKISNLTLCDGDLLLYRNRASALMHAAFCPVLFRLRLPGHPPPLFPWIALVFSSFTNPAIEEQHFQERWEQTVEPHLAGNFTSAAAWALLHQHFRNRDGDVDTLRMRAALARPRPPVEFCSPEYGITGPVFSTIHASKGREADRVFLMLPRTLDYLQSDTANSDEEARVFYVGSTRARNHFLRGIALTMKGSSRLEEGSERVVQTLAEDKLKFQVGLAGDFDEIASVSMDAPLCSSQDAALKHQQTLKTLWLSALSENSPLDISAATRPDAASPGGSWPFAFTCEGQTTAWSSQSFTQDLWTMNNQVQAKFGKLRRPPSGLAHLKFIGLRTCAENSPPALARLREPYASSGFWLAPIIVGFPTVSFPLRRT